MEHTGGVQKVKKVLKKVLTICGGNGILTKLSLRVTRNKKDLEN